MKQKFIFFISLIFFVSILKIYSLGESLDNHLLNNENSSINKNLDIKNLKDKNMIKDHVFRKYDIRGTVGKDYSIESIYDMTNAIALYLKQKDPKLETIAVGMDGRTHSPAIKEQVCKAFIDSGINVIFIGLCPTPVLYFATHVLPVNGGIMITASHNPAKDNGLKITLNKKSVWNKEIDTIKDLYKNGKKIETEKKGIYSEHLLIDEYINFINNEFPNLNNLEINTVIDCANGAGGSVIPLLIEKMKWKNANMIFQEVDGNFPNHEPDPTVDNNMVTLKNYLKENRSISFGLGLDGDCDRLAVMTKDGYLIPGDKLLAIFSKYLKKEHEATVVFDVKCSNGLSEFLKKLGIKACVSPTGHAHIKENMHIHNAILGGELSGHYCFKDRYFGYDDAIYAILRFIELIKVSGKNIEELLEEFPQMVSSPEFRIVCLEEKKTEIIKAVKNYFLSKEDVELLEIDGIRVHMKYGWGLIRASNTEAMLSLRFEGNDNESLSKIKQDFYEPLSLFFKKDWLKEQLSLG